MEQFKRQKNKKQQPVFPHSPSTIYCSPSVIHHPLSRAGFTFVEMLVAISVLLLAIVGPLFLASQGLRAARIARDQINANYLAQEAVEFVRYKRDNNALAGTSPWLSGIDSCTEGCAVDVYQELLQSCSEDGCVVWFHEGTGKYGIADEVSASDEGDWVQTKFTRTVTVTEIESGREAKVTAAISWRDGAITRRYTLAETLLNWQQ